MQLFAAVAAPAPLSPEPIGAYTNGCLAGAVALADSGPNWQTMRSSRNRHFGTPVLVAFLEQLARDAAAHDGWPGLLIGDLSQPRGGPMRDGHASHQIGLDADIWLTPMPERRLSPDEREHLPEAPVCRMGPHAVEERVWTDAHARILRRAALDPRVARIFVAPGIKKKLCDTTLDDRGWLRKVRPWYGHNAHFHVRLACPPATRCTEQAPPPAGDGCGADLDWWYSPEPYKGPAAPASAAKPATLDDLPAACRGVLSAAIAAEP